MTDDRLAPRTTGSPASERSKAELADAHDLIREVLREFQQRVQQNNLKVALELNARQRTVLVAGTSLAAEIASLIESALAVVTDDPRLVVRTASREGAAGLQVETSRGGNVFVLDLDGPPPVTSSPLAGGGLHATKGPQLLVVDDDADTVILMRRALERRGYAVITAASVAEGIEAYARNRIDIVISDLGLPDGSGTDLVRALAKNHTVHAIALTGSSGAEDIERARAAGFSDHITKPVEIGTLERAITRLLANGAGDEHD